jgi:7,8-dihydro-6-hydroxymethylpterin-pyrophosphokinase
MQVLLALTSCCSGIGCGSAQKHMETVNKKGQRPFVIAFRSYSGSRVALHNAANDLLTASGVMTYGGGGSQYEWYHDTKRKHDFIASATLFKSDLPVEQILGMMAAVEERLGGPQREPAPLIKMDLLWVEGVELETPEVTLPNPRIFEEYWANSIFVEASEQAMFIARDEGREKTSTVRRVAKAFKRFQDVHEPPAKYFFTTSPGGEGKVDFARKPGGTVYSQGATDDVDTLAIAGDLLLFAEMDVVRGRDRNVAKDETDEHAYHRAGDALEKLPRDTVLPLQVPIEANDSVDAKAQAWVNGLTGLLAVHHFSGVRTVIYSVDTTRISGAVIGHSAPEIIPYFHSGDAAVSSERCADMPINRNAQEQARDSRVVNLATLYHPRALPSPK